MALKEWKNNKLKIMMSIYSKLFKYYNLLLILILILKFINIFLWQF